MNFIINDNHVLEIIFITFLVSFLTTFVVKKIANHVGAIDIPNKRSVHTKPMPRLGGLAIFAAFLIGYILYGSATVQMISILIGAFIIILTGLIDDIKPIRARHKLIMQIIAALVVVLYGGIYFDKISFLGTNLEFSLFLSYVLSIIFIIAITNAINLIDGLDGLASGVSTIYFITIGIIAFILNKIGGLDVSSCNDYDRSNIRVFNT